MSSSSSAVIGWTAACAATIGFGSFAVPIKGNAANSVNIDPLVMQSYKTIMSFLTSWMVVFFGQEVTFTWWGIVSGLFWVPAGAFNIFAIRNAGIAISQGVVSSSIVTVSFIWGRFIFDEPVQKLTAAYVAVVVIMTGLFGMSYFSSNESLSTESTSRYNEEKEDELEVLTSIDCSFQNVETPHFVGPLEINQQLASPRGKTMLISGRNYSRRNLGCLSALMCGIWGGSVLVPMHYATGKSSGLGFVISFSTGALVVTVMLWILRFGYKLITLKSGKDAYNSLPSFHFKIMWLPGATAGTVWSLGNIGSIIAVDRLGQGVGYSASQAALVVSGLWGIYFFKEISNPSVIMRWFLSAFVAISGILLLGYASSPAVPVDNDNTLH